MGSGASEWVRAQATPHGSVGPQYHYIHAPSGNLGQRRAERYLEWRSTTLEEKDGQNGTRYMDV